MLWACFQFPALPLHAVFAAEASGEHPCALYEGPRQRPVVVHANAAAQARGVRPGLVLATARALCAELDARRREPDAERSALQLLATWAYRFSAQVSCGEPDTVWLEVGASLTLFNGWPALQRQLHAELQTLGFGAYRLGVAPIAAAARVLALSYEHIALRQHAAMRTALERTSIALSGLPAQSIAQLQGMGFRELRDLWRVPRLELTRRLGPAGMHTLAVLRGEATESFTLYQPPDRFARRIELDALVDNWQPLLFPLRRLVNELARYLLVRDGGVQRFELRLEHEDRAATRVPVGLVSVQREAAALYEFCRGRLERASIGAEVSAIALIADDLPPFRPGHRDLFEPSRSEGLDWPALTERLRSRLGDEALQQLACVADHRPERAWRFVAPGTEIRDPAKSVRDAKSARDAKPASGAKSRRTRKIPRRHSDAASRRGSRCGIGVGVGIAVRAPIAASVIERNADARSGSDDDTGAVIVIDIVRIIAIVTGSGGVQPIAGGIGTI
ncbi:DNA polymerase Y family protein [Tahibacter sp. UC22_41]|uniref:Y-family DNA polymerase n=1 Tax=Tahibacter sp. UC22_41 TaxID=3350178 RepID=UPI0036DCDCCC